jgi:hypothetical protein
MALPEQVPIETTPLLAKDDSTCCGKFIASILLRLGLFEYGSG